MQCSQSERVWGKASHAQEVNIDKMKGLAAETTEVFGGYCFV